MKGLRPEFAGFVGRFLVVQLLVHVMVAAIFLQFQDGLPQEVRQAFEAFRPYQRPSFLVLAGQILRAAIVAVVLYPFRRAIIWREQGLLILFGALWGAALVGSVDPTPGSIEGLIYTEVPLLGHLVILFVGGMEKFTIGWLFRRWQRTGRRRPAPSEADPSVTVPGFVLRFTGLHVVTYALVGILAFTLQDYETALASPTRFPLFRPLDHPLVAAAIPIQLLRGALLGATFYPFRRIFVRLRTGWLALFGLVFGLLAAGSPNFMTGLLLDLWAKTPLGEYLVGPSEIFVQMFIFSFLLILWERRLNNGHGD